MISNSLVDGKYGDVIYTFSTANLERSYPFTIEPIRVGFREINKYTINSISIYITASDPIKLLNELQIIIGSIKSGNTSPLLFNKGNKIIDELLQKEFINQNQHENLYKKLSN